MTHLLVENKDGLLVDDYSPSDIIKRRDEDVITVQTTIRSQRPAQDIIVEAWAALDHEHGDKERPYRLQHVHSEGEKHVFREQIQLPHTGRFPLRFRIRFKDDRAWFWFNDEDNPASTVFVDPSYTQDAIVYNAFVRYFGARDVDEDGEIHRIKPGTFGDIENHLDRLAEMGVTVLYLNPVHLIGELYKNYNPHDILPKYLQPGCPYSVKDYKSIDPELSFGFDDDDANDHPFNAFRRLVDAAHSRDIRVYMDLVFNHCAHDSVFQRRHPEWFLYKEDPWSLEDPYIQPEEIKDGKPWGDPEHTMSPYDHSHWWKDAAQLNWNNLEDLPDEAFAGDMTETADGYEGTHPYRRAPNSPPENPTIDAMYDYFINIVTFWIKEFGIDGFRCDVAYRVPTDFWERCIQTARKTAKEHADTNGSVDGDVVFIAEDYHVKCRELLEAGFTACFGDYSNKLDNVPALNGYLDYMYNVGDEYFPDGSQWFIFPECHDFHRNPTKVAKQFRDEHRDADLNANKSRWTLTATLPGIPMIFNGFEKLEWEPASLFSYSKIDWESDKDITQHIKQINEIRHQEPALQEGRYHFIHTDTGITDEASIYSFARVLDDDIILIAVNLDVKDTAETSLHLPPSLGFDASETYTFRELQTGEIYERRGDKIFVSLPPGEAHIFSVERLTNPA